MQSAVFRVEPKLIDWIIGRIQFDDIAPAISEQLYTWREDGVLPTVKQIGEMSRKTHIPFGYFFMKEPPAETPRIAAYRTADGAIASASSRNLSDTLAAMIRAQDWMSEYMRDSGFEALPFVGRFSVSDDALVIARDILAELGLADDWYLSMKSAADSFRYIRSALERTGVMVMTNGVVGSNTHRRLSLNEFRAFTLIDELAPLIFINSRDSDNGRIFSLFHETAHIWLGAETLYSDSDEEVGRDETERLCNAAAAEILVPRAHFLKQWRQTNDIDKLSRYFHCSGFVIVRRALDCGKISRSEYAELVGTLNVGLKESRSDKGGDFYRSLKAKWDRRFIAALDASVREGRTLYTEAYRLTGTNGRTFENLVKGGGQ